MLLLCCVDVDVDVDVVDVDVVANVVIFFRCLL